MRIGTLISLLSSTYGIPEPTVSVVARSLREAGLLTTGARGVNAPNMEVGDVARLTLALLTGQPPSKVVEEYLIVASLQTQDVYPEDGFISKDAVSEHHNLEDAVTSIFAAACDDEHLARFSSASATLSIPPSIEISLDGSRRVAQIDLPNVRTEYANHRSFMMLDELYAVRPMTLDVLNQIQTIEESGGTSWDSSTIIPGRGMRVVRSITEAEILAVCDGFK